MGSSVGPMTMNSRNLLPRAKRGWMLAGIVMLAAILLAIVAPPAHGAPCAHSQQEERSTPPPQATPACCRGSRVAIPQCGRDSMAAGPLAPAACPCTGCSLCAAFTALHVRTAGLALPWTSFHARSMRVLR
jgi:hypothetical protein